MDCNMVSPFPWDWENLIMSNLSKTGNERKQLSTEWDFEKGEGIESIVPDFLGFERVRSGSATSFWHTAVAKGSQSTSINSSSPEVKPCKLGLETSPGDSCSNVESVQVKASAALQVSVASAESDLCLNLGKRTYSEEIWGRNNNDISAVSMKLLTPSVVTRKKSKSGGSMLVPRCQIDRCELDLSSAKDYHRKHRVCENHSKSPKVIVSGLERRFCQQCSRFHAISEFDEKKRSCRKRLSHHNTRRRKPQGVFPLNPDRVYDQRQHTSILWNGLSLNTRSEDKYEWGITYETKPTPTQNGFTLSFQRRINSEEQLFASSSRTFSMCQSPGGFSAGISNIQLPDKGGLHESQDFYSALSLLSNSSDSHGTKHNPMDEPQPVFGTFPTHFNQLLG